MQQLQHYLQGKWVDPTQEEHVQHDAITGEAIGACSSEGLDYQSIYNYGRRVGGQALRQMTFYERGLMLKRLALHLHGLRKQYYPLSYRTGATKGDSWVDIDGGIGTLFAYASLRRQLGDQRWFVDGEAARLSKEGTFIGTHVLVPRQGVAVHINAFNFPIWGMLEKLAVNWLAGMPAIVKPSEVTSFLTEAMVRDIIASDIVPEGALQLVQGGGHGILTPADSQDVITFTGSAKTGRLLKALPNIIDRAVPFNMEADSLNAAILGPDARPGTEEFDLFVKEVRREMTTKCGQKCTAIRRVIVPAELIDDVEKALAEGLAKTTIGDPQAEGVRMGSLVSKRQQATVRDRVTMLTAESTIAFGDLDQLDVVGADVQKGAFFSPILLRNEHPFDRLSTHEIEAFGPVSTLMPYKDLDEAVALANLGKGSLVSTICTYDAGIAQDYLVGAGAQHGRILILNRESAPESTGHGSPMPLMHHGGPGRAGGGQELGGLRSVKHYLQTVALQGHPTMLSQVTQQYQVGGARPESDKHPFLHYFEELTVGQTLTTAKHTVTEADIVNFANLTGDRFYAHVDATSLEDTPFEQRVAHGYWLLSKAAGLFVESRKGPVLLNYGIDSCRFTKPVYPGMTIGVRLTVKEKTAQEQREGENYRKGIVKWLVDMYDETGETVGIATILTMVKMKSL
ncbi:MAG: phenylacetic acid degradation bifunctional protein PaaZ [Lewinella sp.]|nr:phenylacetic acid degradation bifunctional protein PaaZ [Lewinella sp.]